MYPYVVVYFYPGDVHQYQASARSLEEAEKICEEQRRKKSGTVTIGIYELRGFLANEPKWTRVESSISS